MIFSIELFNSSKPIMMIISDTISPLIYSMRPWPNGCSVSAGAPAILKPTSVMMEEPASDRLLKASAVMAMEAVRVPAKNLAANSTRFKKIPVNPLNIPTRWRPFGVFGSAFIKCFTKKFVILYPPGFPLLTVLSLYGHLSVPGNENPSFLFFQPKPPSFAFLRLYFHPNKKRGRITLFLVLVYLASIYT